MRRKYDLDETVFETIDSEEKAYWLGFLMADGCVYHQKYKSKKTGETKINAKHLILELQACDREHLEKFKIFLKSNKPLEKGTNKKCESFLLRFSSNKICTDLEKYGIVPKKSLITIFPNIEEKWNKDFIRGLVDGDGYLGLENTYLHNKSKTLRPCISLCGTEKLLIKVNKIIADSSAIVEKSVKPMRNIFYLKYYFNEAKYITSFLYDKSSIFLNRKYTLYKTIQNYIPKINQYR